MKIIHINRNIIQQNAKNNQSLPVCRIQEGKETKYGMEVIIHGPSQLVYRPDAPLACGAKLWIETESEITIVGETTFSEMKNDKS